jgi:TonB family protein
MTVAGFTGDNLVRYFAQVLIIVSATEIGMRLLRPSSARVRLACWRIVVAICVLLPLIPMRQIPLATSDASPTILHRDVTTTQALSTALTSTVAIVPWLMLSGIIVRATWLCLGFIRLAQLRAESVPFDDAELNELKQTLAPNASIRQHDTMTQPVAFGLRRPIVLLPGRIADLPRDAQRGIVSHELLHVARRDWAWMLVEEALRTALWWHPAIWWALAQVHLDREATIDAKVVAITGARQSYMRALIMFAGAETPVAPVVPFIRRRHLAARLEQLMQEVPMSRMRLTSAIAVLTLIIAGASWASVSALPLQKSADQPLRADQVDTRPRPIVQPNPVYPQAALANKVQGELELEIRVTKDGNVADPRVVKSIPQLDAAAIDALRKWKFAPGTLDGKPVDVLCKVIVRFRMK